ncbi:MAG: PilZ domain-containing protein, partial [Pseudomonas laurylsulfatiphila]
MSTLDEEDRREYYRIEDTIALEIRPLSASEAAGQEVLQDASPLFNLLSELHLSEFESQHLLRQINERDRNIAAFLKSQNKRI